MQRKKKRYGVPYKVRSAGFLVPKRFTDEDEELEDVFGPDDKSELATER